MSGTLKFAAILSLLPAASFAAQLPLSPSSVIGGSGSYGGDFNAGGFNARKIFDQQTGAISEPDQSNFWINPDDGPAAAYITVDLGSYYRLNQVDLYNTHNAQFNDRGTGNFTITASQSKVAGPAGTGFDLGGAPATILSNTLTGVIQGNDPITPQSFGVADSTLYRYVRFNPTSVAAGGASCCGANNYGLNELKVSGTSNQIALAPVNVIGGSGSYGGTYNTGGFNATKILDQQTGNISEPDQSNFWLNPDGGPANAYIVVDLGAEYHLDGIELFNAHNAGFNDRGTGDFNIQGSTSAGLVDGTVGSDVTGPLTPLVTGTLAATGSGADPINSQFFNTDPSAAVRYLRIDPTSVSSSGASCCGANNYGLNEIRVYGTLAVPEPSMLGLLSLAAGALARRRRA